MILTLKIRKRWLFAGGLLLVVLLLLGWWIYRRSTAASAEVCAGSTLIIDAGHGGIDSGSVSVDGTRESDINLQIALKLEKIAQFWGTPTVMTRSDDSRKTDFMSYSERDDLQYRADLVNAVPDGVLVSIHQNYYPTAQPSGAQVIYADAEGSESLGRLTHENLVKALAPDNRRVPIPAQDKIFLLSHSQCPGILVECGFLSNNFEMLRLQDSSYQTSLAVVIAASYLQFIHQKNPI